MLPNWLYGKSKSKLASILGGGGGTPADYDEVKVQVTQNAEDIELLSDTLNTKAALTQISNHNILHNPWFTINQRGATSVTEADGYIADRWKAWSTSTFEVTRNSNGYIAVDNISSDADIIIYQKRTSTYLNSLVGKKLTASVMLEDGTVHSGTITYGGTPAETYFENDAIRLYAPIATTNQILALTVKPGTSIIVKALKLEVGEISTLAMDPRPEYATELAKCQRYFQRIKSTTSGNPVNLSIGAAVSATQVLFPIPITPMRMTPTLAYSSLTIKSPQTGGGVTPTGVIINTAGVNSIMLAINSSAGGITTGSPWYLQLAADGHIDFSADL